MASTQLRRIVPLPVVLFLCACSSGSNSYDCNIYVGSSLSASGSIEDVPADNQQDAMESCEATTTYLALVAGANANGVSVTCSCGVSSGAHLTRPDR